MEPVSLIEGSIIAVFAFLLIREVFQLIKPLIEKRKNGGKGNEELQTDALKESLSELRALRRMIEDLHKWHDDGRDQDGRFMWYVPTSLEKTMGDLAANIGTLGTVLLGLQASIDADCAETRRLAEKIDK